MSTIIIRVIVVVWAIISIGMGVFAFSVVHNISDGHVGIAAQEAFETIPEAIMSMMGSTARHGLSMWGTGSHWRRRSSSPFGADERLRNQMRTNNAVSATAAPK